MPISSLFFSSIRLSDSAKSAVIKSAELEDELEVEDDENIDFNSKDIGLTD